MAKNTRKILANVSFIETMDCLPVTSIPQGPHWTYEIKLDGYRLEVVKHARETLLYSRRRNVLNKKFGYIAESLQTLPDSTVVDGELVAMDAAGRSDFNLIQSFRSAETRILYYAFDLLVLQGQDLTHRPLAERRRLLSEILPQNSHVSLCAVSDSALQLLSFVKKHGLEGVIAKRADSVYEPGVRSGIWSKHRITVAQEFVIGGYSPGTSGFDALIVGVYQGTDLMFAARVRAGFVPATRRELFAQIKRLRTTKCHFANLPEKADGRWGQGLTEEKMKACIWVNPETVVRIEFLQWTAANKLRHTKFVALRDDKEPRKVVRET